MNRRSLLKAILAAPGFALVPWVAPAAPLLITSMPNMVDWVDWKAKGLSRPNFYFDASLLGVEPTNGVHALATYDRALSSEERRAMQRELAARHGIG